VPGEQFAWHIRSALPAARTDASQFVGDELDQRALDMRVDDGVSVRLRRDVASIA